MSFNVYACSCSACGAEWHRSPDGPWRVVDPGGDREGRQTCAACGAETGAGVNACGLCATPFPRELRPEGMPDAERGELVEAALEAFDDPEARAELARAGVEFGGGDLEGGDRILAVRVAATIPLGDPDGGMRAD
jgi:hypothetical protein